MLETTDDADRLSPQVLEVRKRRLGGERAGGIRVVVEIVPGSVSEETKSPRGGLDRAQHSDRRFQAAPQCHGGGDRRKRILHVVTARQVQLGRRTFGAAADDEAAGAALDRYNLGADVRARPETV